MRPTKTAALGFATGAAMLAACGSDDNGHGHDDMERVVIIDRGQTAPTEVAEWERGEGWTADSAIPALGVGDDGRISLGVEIYDDTGTQLIDDSGDFSARYRVADGADDGVLDMDRADDDIFHGDHVHIYGAAEGTSEIEFVLWHDDHLEGHTSAIDVTVGEGADYREMDVVDIRNRGETDNPVVATWEYGEGWDGEIPDIDFAENGRHSLGVDIYDSEGVLLHEESSEWSGRFYVPGDADEGVVNTELGDDDMFHGDHVHVYGLEEGSTELVFVLWHEDHSEAETSPIALDVVGEVERYVDVVDIRDRSETGDPVVARWTYDEGWLEEDPNDGDEYDGLPEIVLADDPARVSLGVDIEDSAGRPITWPGFGYAPAYDIDDGDDVLYYLGEDIGDDDVDEDFLFHGDHVHVYGKDSGTAELIFQLTADDDYSDVVGETAGEEIEVVETAED